MLKLYIGNKNYSSWSMRPWVLMRQAGIAFDEVMVRFDSFDAGSDFKRALQNVNPVGKVPVLVDGDLAVWDTLAIAEYLAERFPAAQLWPAARDARALARSACAEMHSGFSALRSHLPMDLARDQALEEVPDAAQVDIDRVCAIWADCRARFGEDGHYLFGHASIADAFYAPVAARLRSYRVALPPVAAAYVDSLYQWPAFQRWYRAALQEVQG